MMTEAAKEKNVIRATGLDGIEDQLEVIQSQLSLCEKVLAEYLETKRLAFPRFYFSSSADLIDILSNGNQPLMICQRREDPDVIAVGRRGVEGPPEMPAGLEVEGEVHLHIGEHRQEDPVEGPPDVHTGPGVGGGVDGT